MHLPARPDALHDLLAKIAALVEVQSVRLVRLLRKVFLRDVATIQRAAFKEPQGFNGCGRDFDGSGCLRFFEQIVDREGRRDLEAGN